MVRIIQLQRLQVNGQIPFHAIPRLTIALRAKVWYHMLRESKGLSK